MDPKLVKDFSTQLKDVAKDLSFLGHPRYPLQKLLQLFPQHRSFINELEDVSVPFAVDVRAKKRAIEALREDLSVSELAPYLRTIFERRLEDYETLLFMMERFDTQDFYQGCRKLYGTSEQSATNVKFMEFLERMPEFCVPKSDAPKLSGEEALSYLRVRLKETFKDQDVDVRPSTSLLSDSSAGRRVLKLNPSKSYSTQQLDIFLVHEGWAHLGTSLNGAAQSEHLWLSTWAPRTTYLQEGLAILTELITGVMTRDRWSRVWLRHMATTMAERGSEIRDVYAYLRHHDLEDLDAFKLALRVFRGVPLEGGAAFTKELLYLHGLVELLYRLRQHKTPLRYLWAGKMSFEEHELLLLNWTAVNPVIRYFPEGLEQDIMQMRLRRLKELSYQSFNHGFLASQSLLRKP